MDYLFKHREKLRKALRDKFVMIFLDYDGTLTPIVDTPKQALLPQKTKNLLKELAKNPLVRIAIISGRSLSDIKRMVDLKNIIYAGNHGLELEGPKINFRSPVSARYQKAVKKIKKSLQKKISPFKGVFLEDKGLTLSLHYRLADKRDLPLIKAAFREAIIIPRIKGCLNVSFGKKVFEIRPPLPWGKGKIVLWLLARRLFMLKKKQVFSIYIGDDTTDEDAFKEIGKRGLTIFVGKPRASKAEYFLHSPREVFRFLSFLKKEICLN